MANQPKAGHRGHYIAAIPDELWEAARAKAARVGESVAEVVRRALREYVEGEG